MSCGVKPRPRTIGIRSVSKNDGVTVLHVTLERGSSLSRTSPSFATGAPSMMYPVGTLNDMPTESTPGSAGQPALELVVEGDGARQVVADLMRIEPGGHDVRRGEAEIDELRALQAAHAQAGDDQQHERAGDLGDDHRAAQALPARARRCRARRRAAAP